MILTNTCASREIHLGGDGGTFLLGDARARLKALEDTHAGQVKCVYMDPPFMTGDTFRMRVPLGADGWRKGSPNATPVAYRDLRDRAEYLALLRDVLQSCKTLLRDDGTIFVHVDYRASAHVRLLLDEVFGEDHFLNEIIWAYRSGGRAQNFFSRKHDVIFFYRKGESHDFYLDAVKSVPQEPKSNHMRREVDEDGRTFRTIRSGGKIYKYYDDEPVAPSDVWTDISHMQQRDPQRTGYDTQKPLELLKRIIACSTREGDWVLDPFCGSGTTAAMALRMKRKFLAIDQSPYAAYALRRRLGHAPYAMEGVISQGEARCEVETDVGVGLAKVTLVRLTAPRDGLLPAMQALSDEDFIDGWMVGYLTDKGFEAAEMSLRTKAAPALEKTMTLPALTRRLALCVTDVAGRCYVFEIPDHQ